MAKKKRNKNNNGPKKSTHHWRGRGRGGADRRDNRSEDGKELLDKAYPDNESYIYHETHERLHQLFYNDRAKENLAKLLFCWNTTNPYNEQNETNTWPNRDGFRKRRTSWRIIFGEDCTQLEAISHYLESFVRTQEDEEHSREILLDGRNAGKISDNEYSQLMKILEKSK